MAQARLWLWGLVPLVALWLLGAWHDTGRVEADLSARARAVAAASDWASADLEVRGRDIVVVGAAYDPADRAALVAALAKIPGVRRVVSRAKLVPVVAPYVWSATKEAGTLTFLGDVPSPRAKVAMIDGAAGARIADGTTFARGAPDGFAAAAAFCMAQLAGLATGRVAIDGTTIAVSGRAADGAARDKVLAAIEHPPQGFTLGAHEILVK